mmetsp:Transcript_84208/g.238600  ORF Transcript_84208/g.238600 Transcript_84208/m.238600 type:complete len:205 (+) Transcript_84208:568-1182(+)
MGHCRLLAGRRERIQGREQPLRRHARAAGPCLELGMPQLPFPRSQWRRAGDVWRVETYPRHRRVREAAQALPGVCVLGIPGGFPGLALDGAELPRPRQLHWRLPLALAPGRSDALAGGTAPGRRADDLRPGCRRGAHAPRVPRAHGRLALEAARVAPPRHAGGARRGGGPPRPRAQREQRDAREVRPRRRRAAHVTLGAARRGH